MTSARFPLSLQLFTVPPASFDGAFKIPLLRNVALTAPYLHNGDVRTLREVVEL
jgi:cytochrome c peroxidase